jgi:hypothetical protein
MTTMRAISTPKRRSARCRSSLRDFGARSTGSSPVARGAGAAGIRRFARSQTGGCFSNSASLGNELSDGSRSPSPCGGSTRRSPLLGSPCGSSNPGSAPFGTGSPRIAARIASRDTDARSPACRPRGTEPSCPGSPRPGSPEAALCHGRAPPP